MKLPKKISPCSLGMTTERKLIETVDSLIDYLEAKENFHSETEEMMFKDSEIATFHNGWGWNLSINHSYSTKEQAEAAREALLKIKK